MKRAGIHYPCITGLDVLVIARICKYAIFRDRHGRTVGYNCGNVNIPSVYEKLLQDKESRFVSWRSCDLHEYISKKIPFIKPKP